MRKLLLTLAAAAMASTSAWGITVLGDATSTPAGTANPAEGVVTEVPNDIQLTFPSDAVYGESGSGGFISVTATTVLNNTVTIIRDGEELESIKGIGLPNERTVNITFTKGPWTEAGTYIVKIVPADSKYCGYTHLGNYSNDNPIGFEWTYTIKGSGSGDGTGDGGGTTDPTPTETTVDIQAIVQAWAGEGADTQILAAREYGKQVVVKYAGDNASLTIPGMQCLIPDTPAPLADGDDTTGDTDTNLYNLTLTGITIADVTEGEGTEAVTNQVLSGTGMVTDEESPFYGATFNVSGKFHTTIYPDWDKDGEPDGSNTSALINLEGTNGINIRVATDQSDLKKFITTKTVNGLANFWTDRLNTTTNRYGEIIMDGEVVRLNADENATFSYDTEATDGLTSCTFSGLKVVKADGTEIPLGDVTFTNLSDGTFNNQNRAYGNIDVEALGGSCSVEARGILTENEVNIILSINNSTPVAEGTSALYTQFRYGDDVESLPLENLMNVTYDVDASADGTVVNVNFTDQMGVELTQHPFAELKITSTDITGTEHYITVTSTPALEAGVVCKLKKPSENAKYLNVVFEKLEGTATEGTPYKLPANTQYDFTVTFKHDNDLDGYDRSFKLYNCIYDTFIAPNPNYIYIPNLEFSVKGDAMTGVEGIEAGNGEATYYDLRGQRVMQPQGGVFIRVQGGKAVKVMK